MVFIGTRSPYVTGNWQKVFPNIEPAALEKECWSDIAKRETPTMKEGARSSEIERASDGGKEWGKQRRSERASERERERERGGVSHLILLTFRGRNLPKQKIFKFLRWRKWAMAISRLYKRGQKFTGRRIYFVVIEISIISTRLFIVVVIEEFKKKKKIESIILFELIINCFDRRGLIIDSSRNVRIS